MATRQDFYSPNFQDISGSEAMFNEGFVDPQAFMNYDSLVSAPATATSQGASKQDTINQLIKQIQSRSNTSKWSGGYGADEATKDMARILSETGITDISQFGKVDKYEPVEQIGMTLNGQPVQGSGSQLYVLEAVDTGDGTDYVRRDLSPAQAAQVKPTYGIATGTDEYNQPTYRTVEATNVAVRNGQLVGVTGQTFGNKQTGQVVPNTYTERQTGDFFGGTYEGKGNTGYGVQFDDQGLPIFYTQGASSKDKIISTLGPMALLALGAYGVGSLLGAGGAGAAGGAAAGGATGAGLTAGAAELGTLAGTAGGTGLSAGATGFGTIKAGGTALGSIGTGAGLTGTGVLSASTLGTGLLGTGTGIAGLTGTGILSASNLGTGLLGTTSTTPLVGTGILTGQPLGVELLGTGANTAATVGGVTGLTNAANVGAGALNTGVSTGITGLGSGALNTGINPSGASTTGIDPTTGAPTTAAPPASSNPLSNLTPAQLSSLINGAVGLFGAVGAGKALSNMGGGGGSAPRSIPTQGIPLNSEDYFKAIQQNYDRMLPAAPRDVATPLAQWYNSQYGAK
jgi:hypothetical protein